MLSQDGSVARSPFLPIDKRSFERLSLLGFMGFFSLFLFFRNLAHPLLSYPLSSSTGNTEGVVPQCLEEFILHVFLQLHDQQTASCRSCGHG